MLLGYRHLVHGLIRGPQKIPLFRQIGPLGFVPQIVHSAANRCSPYGFHINIAQSFLNPTNVGSLFQQASNHLTPPGLINILQRNHLHLPPLLQGGDALHCGPGAGQGGDGGDGVIEGGAA
jgi:hypothetical protein